MNLEFFNPYLKRIETMCHYQLIFSQFEQEILDNQKTLVQVPVQKDDQVTYDTKEVFVLDDFLEKLLEYINEIKDFIFKQDKD